MALAVDSSVEKRALSAKEWISQSSASQQQQQLSLSSMKKSGSRSKEGGVSPERANESVLFAGMNLAHVGSVEVVLLALDIPLGADNEQEDGIPPLSSTLIKSKSSRSTSNSLCGKSSARSGSLEVGLQAFDLPMSSHNENREDGFPPLTSTASPLIKSKSSKSSSNQGKRDDGIPPLTSTCSPLITSKSSKSSSNQGSLQGLVVAPDGVTLVKDRRKCKPRGVLTVGLETSSISSDGNVALPVPSPSVATVEWVGEICNNRLSPYQSQPDELTRSCSTVTSKSVRSPRVALNFDFHEDCTKELQARDAWPNIREVVDLWPEIVPIQESHDVKDSVEGRRPADLIFAGTDVSFRPPELAPELLPPGKDYSASTSSSKQQHHIRLTQEISPQKQMVVPDTDHDHYIHQSLQLELQDDVNGSSSIEISEEPGDYVSDMTPLKHAETSYLTVGNGETHFGISENRSSELGSFCSLSVSHSLLGSPGNEDASSAHVPIGGLTDLASARGSPIATHEHGEGLEIRGSDLSQLSPEELVAETLYELAVENLRKTRTAARTFNSPEEKKSPMEAASLLSMAKQPVSSEGTSSSGEHATRTDAVPCALSSRISRQGSPRPELVKLDFAQPLRTIVLSRESHFSDELTTLQALIGNVHVEAHDSEVQGLPSTIRVVHVEAQGPAEPSSPFSKKPQRQRRRLSYGYYTSSRSSIRKAQQQRGLSSCGKRFGFGSILAATAAFGVVVVSLAMGSCHQCYKSNHYQYYIRPT